jgi:hypothetical protein
MRRGLAYHRILSNTTTYHVLPYRHRKSDSLLTPLCATRCWIRCTSCTLHTRSRPQSVFHARTLNQTSTTPDRHPSTPSTPTLHHWTFMTTNHPFTFPHSCPKLPRPKIAFPHHPKMLCTASHRITYKVSDQKAKDKAHMS